MPTSASKSANLEDAAIAKRLSRFSPSETKALGAWFRLHPLGVNLALQILEFLEDLAKKQKIPPSQLLEETAQSCMREEMTVKEWGRHIRDRLGSQLHPFQQEHEARFREWVKSLRLSTKARIEPPQNFEGRDFELCVAFSRPEELKAELQLLLESLEQKAWKRLKEF